MTALTSSLPRIRGAWQARRRPGYWPHLLLESVPWLLLATVLRMNILSAPGPLMLVLFPLTQFTIFIAFLVASERAIKLAGGATHLERLAIGDQLHLGRGVLGTLLIIVVAATLVASASSLHPKAIAGFWLGFDGIVFNWGTRTMLLLWSPIVAVLTFLMMVEKGGGRSANLPSALRQFVLRRRHLVPATLGVAAFIAASTFLRRWLGGSLHAALETVDHPTVKYVVYLGFFAVFAYAHLWVTVNILTYALRASYRSGREPPRGSA